MNSADQRKLLNSLTPSQVTEYARQIVALGEADYSTDHFERAFGKEAAVLAGSGYANRLGPAMKKLGFAIKPKMFPVNKKGYSVRRI